MTIARGHGATRHDSGHIGTVVVRTIQQKRRIRKQGKTRGQFRGIGKKVGTVMIQKVQHVREFHVTLFNNEIGIEFEGWSLFRVGVGTRNSTGLLRRYGAALGVQELAQRVKRREFRVALIVIVVVVDGCLGGGDAVHSFVLECRNGPPQITTTAFVQFFHPELNICG